MSTEVRFAWHVHHTLLLEVLTEPLPVRQAYIRRSKPLAEQALRQRLLQEVKGQLPAVVVEAGVAYGEAGAAYKQAWGVYKLAGAAYGEAGVAYGEAVAAYVEAGGVYMLALEQHLPEIEALHRQECPDCPWNGETIFPREEKSSSSAPAASRWST